MSVAGGSGSAVVAVDARWLTRERTGVGVWLAEVTSRWVAQRRPVRLLVQRGRSPDVAGDVVAVAPPYHLRAATVVRRSGWRYLSPDSLIVPAMVGRQATVVVHDLAPLLHADDHHARARLAYRLLLDTAVRRCGTVVVPSDAVRTELAARRGSPRRVCVVPEAARVLPPAASLPAAARSPYLLFVGTLEPRKHVVDLAEAFLAVAPRPWRLVLAGARGWLRREDTARLDAACGSGRVVELGRVDDSVLSALLASADAFAYPSSYEGFGLPVVEAMAAGVPVLTTNAPALAELTADDAVVVDLAGPDAYGAGLRSALTELLGDSALRARLAAAGPARVARLSWEATADAVWTAVTT